MQRRRSVGGVVRCLQFVRPVYPPVGARCCGGAAVSCWPSWSGHGSCWSWTATWRKVGVWGISVWSSWGALGAACSSVCHPLLLPADFIRVVRSFEATRQWCSWLEKDGQRAREQLARAEAERAALEVKLKHARNQVEVEMKKRHRAEAELEKQVCWAGSWHAPGVLGALASCHPVWVTGAQDAAAP